MAKKIKMLKDVDLGARERLQGRVYVVGTDVSDFEARMLVGAGAATLAVPDKPAPKKKPKKKAKKKAAAKTAAKKPAPKKAKK